jgi:hypothetical protein
MNWPRHWKTKRRLYFLIDYKLLSMKFLKVETLSKGWHDMDELMLHACFQCLVSFVEKENGLNHANYEAHKTSVDEVKELYDWWKIRGNENLAYADDKISNKDTEMLIRLIKIRHFLWT